MRRRCTQPIPLLFSGIGFPCLPSLPSRDELKSTVTVGCTVVRFYIAYAPRHDEEAWN